MAGVSYSVALGVNSVSFANGSTTTYTPDDRNRLARTRTANGATTVQDLNFEYYENRNVKRVRDDAVSPVDDIYYTYDELDRVREMKTGSLSGSAIASYIYLGEAGKLGKMTRKAQGSTGGTIAYSWAEHIHAPSSYNGISYAYDASGNLASRGSETFTFDAENHLTLDHNPYSYVDTSRTYDGQGERVRRRIYSSSIPVAPVIDQYMDGLYEDRTYGCAVVNATTYYSAFGRVFAQRSSTSSSSSVKYLLADHLNSTVGAIESSGQVFSNKYYPFGDLRTSSPNSMIAFTGQHREDNSLFDPYYYHARFYSTELGHFLSADPTTADGYNRYGYARWNPLKYRDPSGYGVTGGGDLSEGSCPAARPTCFSDGTSIGGTTRPAPCESDCQRTLVAISCLQSPRPDCLGITHDPHTGCLYGDSVCEAASTVPNTECVVWDGECIGRANESDVCAGGNGNTACPIHLQDRPCMEVFGDTCQAGDACPFVSCKDLKNAVLRVVNGECGAALANVAGNAGQLTGVPGAGALGYGAGALNDAFGQDSRGSVLDAFSGSGELYRLQMAGSVGGPTAVLIGIANISSTGYSIYTCVHKVIGG